MRTVLLPLSDPMLYTEIVDGSGVPVSGLTVTVRVQRASDAKWLQSGGTWNTTPYDHAMTEVSLTHLPGVYRYAIPEASIYAALESAVSGGLMCSVNEATEPFTERIHVSLGSWPAIVAELNAAGLSRTVYSTWSGTTPTSGTIYIYPTQATFDADTDATGTGSIATIPWSATYDVSGRITRFTRGEVS